MAITTELSINSDGNGTVVVTDGVLVGSQGRTVTIQAAPSPGYQFERWEVQTFPVALQVFAVVASQPTATIQEVCGGLDASRTYDGTVRTTTTYQDVARELFTDGTMLYVDTEGRSPAPTGYWGAGGGTYYYWDGGRLPQLQTCTYGTGTGGGGTPPTDGTGDTFQSTNRGDTTVSPSTRDGFK